MRFFAGILALLFLALPLASEEEEEVKPKFRDLRKAMGSDDFQQRTAASQEVWALGEEALLFLVELEQSDDPELALRAAKIRKRIRCGILPDTPPEITKILEEYLDATPVGKKRIARELQEGKHYQYLLRLYVLEENPETKDDLEKVLSKVIPRLIEQYRAAGKFDEIGKLLAIPEDFESLVRYGRFLDNLGMLDIEIEKLRGSKNSSMQARYLAYLRVKGDPQVLLAEARRLGNRTAEVMASLLLGDSLPMLKYYLEKQTHSVARKSLLQILIDRKEGKNEIKAVRELLNLAKNLDDPERAFQALNALYAAGLVEEVSAIQDELPWYWQLAHKEILEEEKEVPNLLGIKGLFPSDRWIEETISREIGILRRGDDLPRYQSRVLAAARFYEARGEYELVAAITSFYLDEIRLLQGVNVFEWCRIFHEEAPRGMAATLAREIDIHGVELGKVIEEIYVGLDFVYWLAKTVREIQPDYATDELIGLIEAYQGNSGLDLDAFEEWNQRLLDAVSADLKNGDQSSARLLGKLWSQQWHYEGSTSYYWNGTVTSSHLVELYRLQNHQGFLGYSGGMLAAGEERWEEADHLLARYVESGGRTNAYFYYLSGLVAQALNEKEKAGEYFNKSRELEVGGARWLDSMAALEKGYGDLRKSYQLKRKAFLMREKVEIPHGFFYSVPTFLMTTSAAREKDWKTMHAMAEIQLLAATERGPDDYFLSSAGVGALVWQFRARIAEGFSQFDEGKREAGLATLMSAHQLLPRSGSLADYFFPELRERGLHSHHDRMCQQSLSLVRGNLVAFPKDHVGRNTFAWIASRSNQNLKEAMKFVNESLEEEPLSAAALDTKAEVYFAMRNRAEAVKWSNRSVSLNISDDEIRMQRKRFKTGKLPTP